MKREALSSARQQLRNVRGVRQRLALSIRSTLAEMDRTKVLRQEEEAVRLERELLEATLQMLMTPAGQLLRSSRCRQVCS